MPKAAPENTRKSSGDLPVSSLSISTHSVNGAFAEMLKPFSAKEIARRIALPSWRTVENWKEGKTSPQAKHVIAMLSDDELCDRLLKMAGKGDRAHAEATISALRKALTLVEGR
jgi:hypothetical protein